MLNVESAIIVPNNLKLKYFSLANFAKNFADFAVKKKDNRRRDNRLLKFVLIRVIRG